MPDPKSHYLVDILTPSPTDLPEGLSARMLALGHPDPRPYLCLTSAGLWALRARGNGHYVRALGRLWKWYPGIALWVALDSDPTAG